MRKYFHVMRVGFQNTMVYRMNFLLRGAFGLIPLLAMIYLWLTIYSGGGSSLGGYTLPGMVSYYLIVTIVDTLTSVTDDDWQIAGDIKDGNISQFLLKPINYTVYRMCLFLSGKLIFAAMSFLPLGIFMFCERRYLVAPANGSALVWFVASLVLTIVLQFFMSYTMALLAFWLLEVSTVIFMLFAFEYIAGGHLFPLNILPPALEKALHFTPFPYLLFFPVSVYLGQVKGADLAWGLATQAGWAIFFCALSQYVWRRGIKKYSAVGG
jgi:ABC-2 type transport system permease protein